MDAAVRDSRQRSADFIHSLSGFFFPLLLLLQPTPSWLRPQDQSKDVIQLRATAPDVDLCAAKAARGTIG